LEKLGKLDTIRAIFPPKNYQVQTQPARMVHEVYQKGEDE